MDNAKVASLTYGSAQKAKSQEPQLTAHALALLAQPQELAFQICHDCTFLCKNSSWMKAIQSSGEG